MGMLKEFKDFAMKGNLIDIAVGFVMGAAFKQVVTSFTGGIVSPLIGLIFNTDLKDLKWIVKDGNLLNPNDTRAMPVQTYLNNEYKTGTILSVVPNEILHLLADLYWIGN